MNINELKKLWQESGFRPSKRLGQNFLIDNNVRDNILKALRIDEESVVVEIGAGFGVMSLEIARRVRSVFAVEKDARICGIMAPVFDGEKNIELVRGDFLDIDMCALEPKRSRLVVFGNIPYYITTPVVEKIIEQRQCISAAYIVMQEEVADRIVSPPGSKDYGALTCFVQFYTKAGKILKISKNSFYPRPNVDSCLLMLEIPDKPTIEVKNKELMFKIIRKAFLQRRKKVLNSLSHGDFLSMDKEGWRRVFEECGIDVAKRAEDLSLSDYARISDKTGSILCS